MRLRRDIKPKLDERGVKLFLVSIGTAERAKLFAQETGFPLENLLADPENEAYDAVGFYKGVQRTFFNPATPFAFRERMKEEGGMDDIRGVLSHWKPWIPPKLDQGLQQGGLLVFQGENAVFTHYDEATADHADMKDVFRALDG